MSGFSQLQAAEVSLSINSNFPGGNIIVNSNEGSTVRVSPDLRTNTSHWFYWYFEAEASAPGRVTFIFTGHTIGVRGPAVSTDDGKTWKWLGKEVVTYLQPKTADSEGSQEESFFYDFKSANQKVRFSVGFPYVQSNLDEFLKAHESNPNLKQSILATTTGGLPVELLQIGEPGDDKIPVLVAGRSHANEALTSYVLEGFLEEAMSDSFSGREFREKYVLYAAPILDKDGVQAGDQGKNRAPHDHNRDYGPTNLYPEITALQQLGAEKRVQIAIDFHSPFLRGEPHEAFFWMGNRTPQISNNADEYTGWIAQEIPLATNAPLNFLSKPKEPQQEQNIPFSWYFDQKGAMFAITFEAPFAQAEDIETVLAYGRAMLRGFVRTQFVKEGEKRTAYDFAAFNEQNRLILSMAGQPAAVEEMASGILNDPAAPGHFRVLAHLGHASMLERNKRFQQALEVLQAVAKETGATHIQNITARSSKVSIQSLNPDATTDDVLGALRELEAYPYWGEDTGYKPYSQVSSYFERQLDLQNALKYAEKQAENGAAWKTSGSMLRIAGLLDALGQADAATAKRKEVVTLLQPIMLPAPEGRSIMLGIQTGDFFEAVTRVPTSTQEEKVQAALVVMNFPTVPAEIRGKVQNWLEQNGVPVPPKPE